MLRSVACHIFVLVCWAGFICSLFVAFQSQGYCSPLGLPGVLQSQGYCSPRGIAVPGVLQSQSQGYCSPRGIAVPGVLQSQGYCSPTPRGIAVPGVLQSQWVLLKLHYKLVLDLLLSLPDSTGIVSNIGGTSCSPHTISIGTGGSITSSRGVVLLHLIHYILYN